MNRGSKAAASKTRVSVHFAKFSNSLKMQPPPQLVPLIFSIHTQNDVVHHWCWCALPSHEKAIAKSQQTWIWSTLDFGAKPSSC